LNKIGGEGEIPGIESRGNFFGILLKLQYIQNQKQGFQAKKTTFYKCCLNQ
jgi:hypothetical protein